MYFTNMGFAPYRNCEGKTRHHGALFPLPAHFRGCIARVLRAAEGLDGTGPTSLEALSWRLSLTQTGVYSLEKRQEFLLDAFS
jgi:hypothetical protein